MEKHVLELCLQSQASYQSLSSCVPCLAGREQGTEGSGGTCTTG